MLVGFTNSDWVNDRDDRKYTAGYVFTWACNKQKYLALSLANAEYRATVNASQEALWLR